MNGIISIFVFYLLSECSVFSHEQRPLPNHRFRRETNEAGERLYLSPLIDAGNLSEARKLSKVEPPLLNGVESYTGFLTVNKTVNAHLFFWFIPRTTIRINDTASPLILWLQGGPGMSSLFGLFTENGPFRVNGSGQLEKRQHSWTDHYHMLYIDQPVGSGFSFAENDKYSMKTEFSIAEHLHDALLQFYKIFPDFKDQDFYIAGESYAGKYIPALGNKIHTTNEQARSNVFHIPLKGMMIGNGFSDPENMGDFATHLRALGMIDEEERVSITKRQDMIKYSIRGGNFMEALGRRIELLSHIRNIIGFQGLLYDHTRDDWHFDQSYVNYISKNEIRKRIHVGSGRYSLDSYFVIAALNEDYMQSVRPWVETLLENYRIIFYSGQFDLIVSHLATESFLSKLKWSGAMNFSEARQQTWWSENRSVAGYYKSANNLVYVMVRNAGHEVPTDQPQNALNLIDKFIRNEFTGHD